MPANYMASGFGMQPQLMHILQLRHYVKSHHAELEFEKVLNAEKRAQNDVLLVYFRQGTYQVVFAGNGDDMRVVGFSAADYCAE